VLSSHGETDADDNDIFRTSSLLPAGLRRAVRSARATTACSPSVAADLTDNFGAADVVVVPNGVAPIDLGPVARVPGRVVGVGRLEHNKGFDLLIRAMALVDDGDLLLVGDGRERGSLETLARSLGITHRVMFAGARSQEETRRAVAASSVLVMPSRRESFGIVALEAWSAGTPLVATSRCGPAAFVKDGVDALLVDPCDIPALARSVRAVLDDPKLACRLAAAGRERVVAYSWAAVVDRYERIYDRVLAD
jgi:glycogen synthase